MIGLPGTAAQVVAGCTSHLGRHIGPRGRRERNSQHPPHRRCGDGVGRGSSPPTSTLTQRIVADARLPPARRCLDFSGALDGASPPIPRAALRKFVKNSYVRQVISEGAPRAPGAQYIWFGSFLPPLARHSS